MQARDDVERSEPVRHAHAVVVRRTGGSLRVTLPPATVARLHLRAGDVLFALDTELGLLLTPYDDRVERAVARWDRLVRSRRGELRQLARER